MYVMYCSGIEEPQFVFLATSMYIYFCSIIDGSMLYVNLLMALVSTWRAISSPKHHLLVGIMSEMHIIASYYAFH